MKLAVFFHLGNPKIWFELKPYIESVLRLDRTKHNVDLYISYINKSDRLTNLRKLYPDATFILANKGMDIGGMLRMWNVVYTRNYHYDAILYLHTKTNTEWRRQLLTPIAGSPDTVESVLQQFSDDIGLIGGYQWICPLDDINYETLSNIAGRWIDDHWLHPGKSHFIAGTCYWMKWPIIKEFIKSNNIDLECEYNKLEASYRINTSATYIHAWERLVGIIVESQGYSIKGVYPLFDPDFYWNSYSKLYNIPIHQVENHWLQEGIIKGLYSTEEHMWFNRRVMSVIDNRYNNANSNNTHINQSVLLMINNCSNSIEWEIQCKSLIIHMDWFQRMSWCVDILVHYGNPQSVYKTLIQLEANVSNVNIYSLDADITDKWNLYITYSPDCFLESLQPMIYYVSTQDMMDITTNITTVIEKHLMDPKMVERGTEWGTEVYRSKDNYHIVETPINPMFQQRTPTILMWISPVWIDVFTDVIEQFKECKYQIYIRSERKIDKDIDERIVQLPIISDKQLNKLYNRCDIGIVLGPYTRPMLDMQRLGKLYVNVGNKEQLVRIFDEYLYSEMDNYVDKPFEQFFDVLNQLV